MTPLTHRGRWSFLNVWPWVMGLSCFALFGALGPPPAGVSTRQFSAVVPTISLAAIFLVVATVRVAMLKPPRRRLAGVGLGLAIVGFACMQLSGVLSPARPWLLWWPCLVLFAAGLGLGVRSALLASESDVP